jgi:hypothetical protein
MNRGAILLFALSAMPSRAGEPVLVGDVLGGRIAAGGCGLQCVMSQPLRKDIADASAVVVGTLANPRRNPAGGDGVEGVTDLNLLRFVKATPALLALKSVTINRYVEVKNPKQRYLISLDLTKNKIEAYRGIELKSNALPDYLRDALRLDPRKPEDALTFFHRHLTSADRDVSGDALREILDIPYDTLRRNAALLPLDKILARFGEKGVSNDVRAVDGLVLGHVGIARYADVLRKQIEAHRNETGYRALDGLLIGYTLLKPKEGIALFEKIMGEAKAPFLVRYVAMRGLRFFRHVRPDVLPKAAVADAVAAMLSQPDAADLAIEELRRQGEARFLDRVLALHGKKEFDAPIVRRHVLRYALTFAGDPKAARFLDERRKEDPDRVRELEEQLREEERNP